VARAACSLRAALLSAARARRARGALCLRAQCAARTRCTAPDFRGTGRSGGCYAVHCADRWCHMHMRARLLANRCRSWPPASGLPFAARRCLQAHFAMHGARHGLRAIERSTARGARGRRRGGGAAAVRGLQCGAAHRLPALRRPAGGAVPRAGARPRRPPVAPAPAEPSRRTVSVPASPRRRPPPPQPDKRAGCL